MYEYCICPISFRDYSEYVDKMNETHFMFGQGGWELVQMIRVYENSPMDGWTTHDWVCRRKKDSLE